MRSLSRLVSATVAALVLGLSAQAHAQVVKIGTIAPEGSTWHKALVEMGDKWKDASGGKVKLKIFAGGVQGDEGDMVRKMRVGQLSASAITAVGLHDITPEPQALMTPSLIRTYEELDYVMEKMGPSLEKSVADKGFIILTWSEAGFVYFFSQEPAATPADLAKQPLFSWAGDPKAEEAWKVAGFKPVVVSSVDMVPSLQTKMLQSFATSALLASSIGWFNYAKNMTDLSWGVLPGAVVMSKEQWDKIPADLQPKLLEIARGIGKNLRTQLRQQGTDAIAAMKGKGLNVVAVNDTQKKLWFEAAEKSWTVIRGGVVPAATFDEVKKHVTEFRAQPKK